MNLKFFKKASKKQAPTPRVKHQWQMVSRSYAAPVNPYPESGLDKLPQDMGEKLVLGVTTYLWECLLTGDIRTEEILGSDTQVLAELLNKVKQYGKQIVKDDGGDSFVIDLLKVDPMTLPKRRV